MRLHFFYKVKQKCSAPEKLDENCHGFANSHGEMLSKAVGQLLGNVKRVQQTC
jgi:hypothetical protein